MPRTFLFDGTALAYRAHFAFTGRGGGLTTADGHPTSATYGFTLTLRAILNKENPDRIAVAFDGPREKLERTKIYPDYKATREKAPEELTVQFDDVRKVVEAHGIRIIEIEGQEADDVIGTLAVQCKEAGDEVYIVTGDKDFMQLVDGEKLRLYDIKRGTQDAKVIGPDEVEEKFGVPPEQIIDLLALMGDSSDNVPGVTGVGPKTAATLLQEHKTLEAVLDAADSIKKPKLRENLLEQRDNALLSKRLVTLNTDLELDVGPGDLGPAKPHVEALLAEFQRLEFRNFYEELSKQLRDSGGGSDPGKQDYRVVESLEECHAVRRRLEAAGQFAFGVTTSEGRLIGMSFCIREGRAFYVPLKGTDLFDNQERGKWLAALAPALENPSLAKIGHGTKHALKVLHHAGVELGGVMFDTLLASYCVAADTRHHTLADLTMSLLELHKTGIKEVVGTGKKAVSLALVPVERIGEFACEEVDCVRRLLGPLQAEIESYGVRSVFETIEMPLVPVLARMELRGIKIDTDYLAELSVDMETRIADLTENVHKLAGESFNIQSSQQLGHILFDKLELHKKFRIHPKKTPTGQWSTDASVLERLKEDDLVTAVLEFRQLAKLKSTYTDSLPSLVNPKTGRVHTTFNQAVAATGRLSSEDPNLQNIPIRTEEGKKIRRAFVPGLEDWVLLSADYSQVELRLLAHMSKDENLIAGFAEGEDVHARTASIVFDVPPDKVTQQMRSQAKVVNYGLIYGMGANRLARETGFKVAEARQFIETYFKAMPRVKGWLDDTMTKARQTHEIRTLFGRRRPVPDVASRVPRIRAAAENVAVNTPIQGSAADIIKRAMIDLDAKIRREGLEGRMLLQVHDELVIECPESETETMSDLVRASMEGAADLMVPLSVDVGVGKNWLEAH